MLFISLIVVLTVQAGDDVNQDADVEDVFKSELRGER